jgi:hypothetical protein
MNNTDEHSPGMSAIANVGIRFECNGTVTLISKTVDYGRGPRGPFLCAGVGGPLRRPVQSHPPVFHRSATFGKTDAQATCATSKPRRGLQIHIKMWRCHRCSRWKGN